MLDELLVERKEQKAEQLVGKKVVSWEEKRVVSMDTNTAAELAAKLGDTLVDEWVAQLVASLAASMVA